jgi:glutamate synthase (NADPH/NADH) large chain
MPDAYAAVIKERDRDDVRNELPPAADSTVTAGDTVRGHADD